MAANKQKGSWEAGESLRETEKTSSELVCNQGTHIVLKEGTEEKAQEKN